MNALTVNLHLLLASFYRPAGARRKILMEAGAFPSDQYAAATQAQLHGLAPAEAILTVAPREGERLLRTQVIPTPSYLLDRISPIFAPFFLVFGAFSPSQRGGSNEPQAGPQGQQTAGASAKRGELPPSFFDTQVQWEGSPGPR